MVFISCNNSQSADYSKKASNVSYTKEHPGKVLIKQLCYACHNITSSHDSRIAPPMIAVKRHYVSKHTTQKEFTEDFVSFVLNPSKDKAKMKGAIRKFNLMPKQIFKKEDLEKIADYIYNNKIEEPSWFENHWQERGNKRKGKMKGKNQNQKKILGSQYAMNTKQQLAKNLIKTIQKEGVIASLKYCNTRAIPITDSMSVTLNADIKRVSNKPRNLTNKATIEETELIEMFQKRIHQNKPLKPQTRLLTNGKTQYYAPIITNQICLQCHGKRNKNIIEKTLLALKELYPKDQAIGYEVNQVRGLWSIKY